MRDWDYWVMEELEFIFSPRPRTPKILVPPCNIYETKDKLVIQVELPGVRKEDLTVEIRDRYLRISGRRIDYTEGIEKKYHAMEFSYGPFERIIKLPENLDLDRIVSALEAGILRIEIYKKPEKVLEIEVI